MKRFKLTETQAEAILELRLRKLAKLEEMRIRGELEELGKERRSLQQILGSRQRLKTLIKNEIQADAEKYGDSRRSPIVKRPEAKALAETELAPAEPITVILSEKGWIRAAKGHDIDAAALAYRSGDGLRQAATGRSNQQVVVLDSTGRCYALPAHTLPSARGLGEPVSGRVTPPEGATFAGVMIGPPESLHLLASDAGYGFVARLEDTYARNRSGKVVLSLPAGSRALAPAPVSDPATDRVAMVSSGGRLLLAPVRDLPAMARGKGLKILHIPGPKLKSREEFVVAMTVIRDGEGLLVHSGKRTMTLRPSDLEPFVGERGRRGALLPRGYRQVNRLSPAGRQGSQSQS